MRSARFLILVLPWAVVLGLVPAARAEDHVVETVHYRVHVEGTKAQADEAARVLEAAWPAFEAHFGAAPKLAPEERLTVRLVEGREAFEAAIRADDTEPPKGAGGYYWPASRTAYLFRQPTVYFTRTLLIHEAAHQFHYLARTRNKNPKAAWYTEGTAEYLSWHRWDGEKLTLGVVPGVTLKDYPAAALAEATAQDFSLEAAVDGSRPASRPVAWALYRYLATGRDGKPLKNFETLVRKMDTGGNARLLFRKLLGGARKRKAPFLAWLRAHQTTWAPVFNEWEEVGDGCFRGYASVVSACRTKAPATAIAATLRVADEPWWRGGLLLHHASARDYTVALYDAAGTIRVHRMHGGGWDRLYDGRLPRSAQARVHRLEAERRGEVVTLRIDGSEVGAWALPAGPMGLAVERSDLRFDSVVVR